MLKNLRNRLSDNKGFSLVELIVVIAIMVILIAILVPNITGYINKARDVSTQATAKTIYDAAYAYQTELIGKAQTSLAMSDTVLVSALNNSADLKYYLDVKPASIVSGSTPTGDSAKFSVGVGPSSQGGKITVYYHSLVDGSKVYPASNTP